MTEVMTRALMASTHGSLSSQHKSTSDTFFFRTSLCVTQSTTNETDDRDVVRAIARDDSICAVNSHDKNLSRRKQKSRNAVHVIILGYRYVFFTGVRTIVSPF